MPIVVSPAAAMPVEVSPDVAAVRSTTAAVIRSAAATRSVAVAADRSEVVVAVARAAAVAATAADTDKFYRLANNGRRTLPAVLFYVKHRLKLLQVRIHESSNTRYN